MTLKKRISHHPITTSPPSGTAEPIPWFACWKFAPVYGYFVLSAFFLFTIQTPDETTSTLCEWNLHYLSIPIIALVLGMTYAHRRYLYRVKKTGASVWSLAIFLCCFGVLFAFPYELALNAASHGTPVILRGMVISKNISVTRYYTTRKLVIFDENLRREVSFHVSLSTYNNFLVGQEYGEEMCMGTLGFPYRWIWQNPHSTFTP